MFRLIRLILPILLLCSTLAHAVPKPWERVQASYLPNRSNDGDSFHAIIERDRSEVVARLYAVDTIESDTSLQERISAQADYFGITLARAAELAHQATTFTATALSRPFTITTRWSSALGRSAIGRIYCIITTDRGEDLGELLVRAGLARIHGTPPATMINSGDIKAYIAKLRSAEDDAKGARRGGWSVGGGSIGLPKLPAPATAKPSLPPRLPNAPSVIPPSTISVGGAFVGSRSSKVFHSSTCSVVNDIKPANIVNWATREAAVAEGRTPCHRCNP